MRPTLVFAAAASVPFLFLAACGSDDDAFLFDYRQRAVTTCVGNAPTELNANGRWSDAAGAGARAICDCTVRRHMAAYTPAQLRDQQSRTDLTPEERAAQGRFFAQCTDEYLAQPGAEPPQTAAVPAEEPPPPPRPGFPADALALGENAGGAQARANLASYVTADDYPAAALRNGEQGRVAFALEISPKGRVTDCTIRESSGSAALDSTTCRIMRVRARYTPARDGGGRAIASREQAAVTWVLPTE